MLINSLEIIEKIIHMFVFFIFQELAKIQNMIISELAEGADAGRHEK